MSAYRTDRNNNPTAFTTDIAKQAGLVFGTDYVQGDPFSPTGTLTYDGEGNPVGVVFFTAKLLGDPVGITIEVLDNIGFRVGHDPFKPRWTYINLPYDLWMSFSREQKVKTIGDMYKVEEGTEMLHYFS